jgi:hypothetical protein
VLTLLLALILTSRPTFASNKLTLESLEGDQAVIVTDGKTLEPHPAAQGEELHFWDVIQTSKRAAAKIRYPDGSLLAVGRDTKFTIQPKDEGTQYNRLDWGQVRAQVVPDGIAKSSDLNAKTPPRFIIRTRTAVMGVRGTDFVAGFDPGSAASSLHTIEGSVDIGSSESAVMAWKGTPVNAGQTASMDSLSASPTVAAFKPEEYKAQMQSAQPELSKIPDRAESATTSSTLIPPKPGEESWLSLLSFRVGSVSILQNAKLQYTNIGLSWNPVARVLGILSIRGHAGGTRIKNASTGNQFPVVKLGVLADFDLPLALHAELGGGQMIWVTDTIGTQKAFVIMGNVVWRFAPDKWLDSIYAGGTRLMSSDGGDDSNLPFEVAAGVGMRF